MLAQVQLPLQDSENDARQYDDDRAEIGGFGAANAKVSLFIIWAWGKIQSFLAQNLIFVWYSTIWVLIWIKVESFFCWPVCMYMCVYICLWKCWLVVV